MRRDKATTMAATTQTAMTEGESIIMEHVAVIDNHAKEIGILAGRARRLADRLFGCVDGHGDVCSDPQPEPQCALAKLTEREGVLLEERQSLALALERLERL